MNILTQFAIIIALCLAGEVLSNVIPFPIPATIIALVLLFVLLKTKLLKLQFVEDAGDMLIRYMPILFVPAGVRLVEDFGYISSIWFQLLLLSFVSTILVFIITLYTVKFVLKLQNRRAK